MTLEKSVRPRLDDLFKAGTPEIRHEIPIIATSTYCSLIRGKSRMGHLLEVIMGIWRL